MSNRKTRIVKFADRDELNSKLKDCMEYNAKHRGKPLSFSQFLARTTLKERLLGKTDDDLVIADLSDLQVQVRDLKNLDFGEVILNGTTFSGADLSGATISSHAGMEGLKFENDCSLRDASIEGDLGGVVIGGGTDITELDLTKASGIAKCKIDAESVKGTGIKIPFANIDAFDEYLDSSPKEPDLTEFKTSTEDSKEVGHEFVSLADLAAKGRDEGVRQAERALNVGIQVGEAALDTAGAAVKKVGEAVYSPNVPTSPKAAWNLVKETGSWGLGILAQGASAIGKKVLGDESAETDSKDDKKKDTITEKAPAKQIFTCSDPKIDLAAENPLTLEDLKDWNEKKSSQTLEAYAKSIGKSPLLRGIEIENIDFKGKSFGEVTFAAVSFIDSNIENSTLEKVSILDSKFLNTNFREVSADGIRIARGSFSCSRIEKSNFDRADFTETKFEETAIYNIRLQNSNLHRTYFRDTEIEKSYLDNAKMDYAIGESLKLKEVAANHIDMTSSKFLESTMDKVDLTGATAHNLAMPKSTIKDCKLNEMEANAINLQESQIANVEIDGSNLAFSDFSGSDISNLKAANSNLTKVRIANSTSIEKTSFENVTAPGIDMQGSTIEETSSILHSSMQNAKMAGITIKGKISKSDLNDANIEKANIDNAILEDSHFKGANLKSAKIHGGSLERSNFSGADFEKTELGAESKLTSVKDMVLDQTTKMTDTKFASGSDNVTHIDLDGKKTKKSLDLVKAESAKEQDINNASLPRKWFRAAINTTADLLKLTGDGAESVGSSITKRRKSRTGAISGAIVGIAVGAALVGAIAGTVGAALPVVAAIVIGSTTVAGTVAGHVIENTSPGRRLFMGVATAGSTMAFGIAGLLAAPALIAYNLVTGRRNAFSTALGTTFQTIGRLSKRVGAAVAGLSYSDKELVEANDVKEAREKSQAKVAKAEATLTAAKADKKKMRQNRVRRFFTRPFAKRGKKEAEIGIVHESIIKDDKIKPLPSAPKIPPRASAYKATEEKRLSVGSDGFETELATVLKQEHEVELQESTPEPVIQEPGIVGKLWNGSKWLVGLGGAEETRPETHKEELSRPQSFADEEYPASETPSYSDLEAEEHSRKEDIERWAAGGSFNPLELEADSPDVPKEPSEVSFKSAKDEVSDLSSEASFKSLPPDPKIERKEDEKSVISSSSEDSFLSATGDVGNMEDFAEEEKLPKSHAQKEAERKGNRLSIKERIEAGRKEKTPIEKKKLTAEAIAERDAAEKSEQQKR